MPVVAAVGWFNASLRITKS